MNYVCAASRVYIESSGRDEVVVTLSSPSPVTVALSFLPYLSPLELLWISRMPHRTLLQLGTRLLLSQREGMDIEAGAAVIYK